MPIIICLYLFYTFLVFRVLIDWRTDASEDAMSPHRVINARINLSTRQFYVIQLFVNSRLLNFYRCLGLTFHTRQEQNAKAAVFFTPYHYTNCLHFVSVTCLLIYIRLFSCVGPLLLLLLLLLRAFFINSICARDKHTATHM